MTTATAHKPGTVLRVRGYIQGHRTAFRDAVVLGEYMDRAVLWFFNQGAPANGTTVQPLFLDSEYRATGYTVDDLPDAKLRKMRRELNLETGNLAEVRRMLDEMHARAGMALAARAEGGR